jgi:predicted nucleic acid-binding protein
VTRAVFNCVILLQAAARRSGPAAECLQAVRGGRLKLFLSPDFLAEVRDVLSRPKTLRKFPALTPEAVDVFLDDVANNSMSGMGAGVGFVAGAICAICWRLRERIG